MTRQNTPGSPFLHDLTTNDIVGLKDKDGGEKLFVYTDGSQGALTGPVAITDTTASTSTTTGALTVTGGVGIGGAIRSTDGFIGTPITRGSAFYGLLDDIGFVGSTGTIAATNAGSGCYCPTNDRIYVASLSGSAIRVINPATNAVVATITGGTAHRQSAYCPTNNCIYIAQIRTNLGCLVINCATNAVVTEINTGSQGDSCCYCPTTDRIYVSDTAGNNVNVIDPATNTIDGAAISLDGQGRGLCYCPSNDRIYAPIGNVNEVSVIDPVARTKTDIALDAGSGLFRATYCPSNNCVYVSDFSEDEIHIIDAATNTEVAGSPVAVGNEPYEIIYNPRTDRLYISHVDAAASARIIDPKRNAVAQTVSHTLAGAYCPSNGRVYASSGNLVRVLT